MAHMNSKMKMKNWIGYDCWCLHHMVNYLSEVHLKLLIVVHYKTATQDNRSIIALISKFEANRQWHLPLKNNAHQSTLRWNTWLMTHSLSSKNYACETFPPNDIINMFRLHLYSINSMSGVPIAVTYSSFNWKPKRNLLHIDLKQRYPRLLHFIWAASDGLMKEFIC